MGSLFKQQFTKPIPTNSDVVRVKGRRYAQWLNKRGKQQTAPLNAEGTRIVRESKVYLPDTAMVPAKYKPFRRNAATSKHRKAF